MGHSYTVWYHDSRGDNLFVSGVDLTQAETIKEELEYLGLINVWIEAD